MKIINLDSKYELTHAQVSYVESVLAFDVPFGGVDPVYPTMNTLTEQIPVFLFSSASMPSEHSLYEDEHYNNRHDENFEKEYKGEVKPSTEWLGFYKNKAVIENITTPIIGLCPERIMKCVNNDEELMILTAKVLIHEFAHAQMNYHPLDPRNALTIYNPYDEFYKWIEESHANLITLARFKYFERSLTGSTKTFATTSTSIMPLDFVKDFISKQPDNYKFGLDLFNVNAWSWWKWRDNKAKIFSRTIEKDAWLNYAKLHLGKGTLNRADLYRLVDDLIR